MNILSSLFQRYTNRLKTAPLSTKMLTSCFIFGASDIICQFKVENKSLREYSPLRTFRQTMIGTFFVAPTLHVWHSNIIPFVTKPIQSRIKVMVASYMLGEGVLSPYFLSTTLFFYEYLGTFNVQETYNNVKEKFVPTLIRSFQFWGVVSLFTYSIVPVTFRPVFSNCFSLLWQIYLSYIANKGHKDLDLEDEEPYPVKLATIRTNDIEFVSEKVLLANLLPQ